MKNDEKFDGAVTMVVWNALVEKAKATPHREFKKGENHDAQLVADLLGIKGKNTTYTWRQRATEGNPVFMRSNIRRIVAALDLRMTLPTTGKATPSHTVTFPHYVDLNRPTTWNRFNDSQLAAIRKLLRDEQRIRASKAKERRAVRRFVKEYAAQHGLTITISVK